MNSISKKETKNVIKMSEQAFERKNKLFKGLFFIETKLDKRIKKTNLIDAKNGGILT